MKKIMKQIYARMWLAWRLLRLHFVRIPESEDGKSQEQCYSLLLVILFGFL